MPLKLYYSLLILICLYVGILLISGGFTIHVGKITFSSHRSSMPVLLIIILTLIQFLTSVDFRSHISKFFGRLTDNNRYFLVFILSLLLIEIVFGALHIIFFGRIHAFDLDREFTIATYFSAFLFFANSLIVGAIYQFEQKDAKGHKGWWFVGFVFFYLSLDEVARLHESIIPFMKKNVSLLNFLYGSNKYWVVFMGPIILITIVYLCWFLFKRLKGYPWIFTGFIAALSLWIFVIALEFWEGYTTSAYKYKALVEEGSEMIGSTLFLASFLAFFKKIRD